MSQDIYRILLRIAAAVIGVVVVILLVFAVWHAIAHKDTVAVKLIVAPHDAIITINQKGVSGQEVSLRPGVYRYTVARDHFATKHGTLTITADNPPTLIEPLSPTDPEGEALYKKYKEDYLRLEQIAGATSRQKGEALQTKNPILRLLPYKNLLFTIGYKTDVTDPSGQSIILTIHAEPAYYDAAITQISNWGYNPADYNIEITNEENPFHEK